MLKKLQNLVTTRPILFVVVYDEAEQTFSRPHPTAVLKSVELQPWHWSSISRAKSLLKPKSDRVTYIKSVTVFHSELRDDTGRDYVFVSGNHFSFKQRIGRDFFDPKTDDLIAKFGEPDGQIVAEMIEYFLPHFLAKAA